MLEALFLLLVFAIGGGCVALGSLVVVAVIGWVLGD